MEKSNVKIDKEGRVLIPAKIRKELDVSSGDEFTVRVVEGRLELTSKAAQRRIAKSLVKASLAGV